MVTDRDSTLVDTRPVPGLARLSRYLQIALVAAIYFASSQSCFAVLFTDSHVSRMWPPAGVGLAAVLLLGSRIWPGVLVGAFFASLSTEHKVAVSALIAAGNTLEALLGGYLTIRFTQTANPVTNSRDLLRFVTFAVLPSAIVGAALGTGALWIAGRIAGETVPDSWMVWGLGDAMGCLVMAPLLTTWFRFPQWEEFHTRIPEASGLLALLLAVSWIAFRGRYPLAYATMPFLVWAAYRFGQYGGTIASVIVAGIATWATADGTGQFAIKSLTRHESFLLLQLFVGAGTGTTLILGSLVSERKQAQRVLASVEERCQTIIENALYGIFQAGPDGRYLAANPALARMYGYSSSQELMDTLKMDGQQHYLEPGRHTELIQRLKEQDAIPEFESQVRRKDGSVIWISESARAVRDQHGDILYVEGIVEDITARKRAEEVRQQLLDQLVSAQEEERSRVARELHDALGGHLSAMTLGLTWAAEQARSEPAIQDHLAELKKQAGELMQEVHHLAWELWPATLDIGGIDTALQHYSQEWSQRSGVQVQYHSAGLETGRLPRKLETALYRVVQEALTNVLKHARASHVSILVERRKDHVLAIVEDDGIGFEPEAPISDPHLHGHLGLAGMQERVSLVHGRVVVESTPGIGTTIYVHVPLEEGPQ